VAFGLLLAGLGKSAGFAQFGGSTEAFLASLAPLLGVLIVLSLVLAWSSPLILALSFFLTAICGLLAPVVIADILCRLWQRQDRWARYANVLNCTQWLWACALAVLILVQAVFVSAGASMQVATGGMLVVFLIYVMWFHWFAARHVLDLSAAKALLMMLAVVFGTLLVLQLPLVPAWLAGVHTVPLAPPAK
jgi:hypothetical protein